MKPQVLKQVKRIILPAMLVFLSACYTSYHVVSFEILKPAEITFPDSVGQLLALERLPPASFLMDTITLTTFGRTSYRGLDTLISYNMFRGLFDCLKQSPLETHNWPTWASDRSPAHPDSRGARLNKEQVAKLCLENRTDAILSLEKCFLSLRVADTSYTPGYIFEPSLRGTLSSQWAVYIPDYLGPYKIYEIRESIYQPLNRRSGNIYQIVGACCYQSGLQLGKKVTPVWTPASRQIYGGSHPALVRASRDTGEGNWDQAFERWSGLAASGSRKNQARSLYNMAVYYELEDRLDSASSLLGRATQLHDDEQISAYHTAIRKRIHDRQSIWVQVEGARIQRHP